MTNRAAKRRCRSACHGAGFAGGVIFALLLGLGPAAWSSAILLGLGVAVLLAGMLNLLFCRSAGATPPVRGSNTGRPMETGAPMGEVEARLEAERLQEQEEERRDG
ncbi:hypothetical protein [Pseudoroseicyclus tamaricis]|uniref:Uncharacterized protein n=1 Tax=Pseudoroseicyclus tamaricis TaxID=2705421 RepID=A0A6B2K486_9RHOB|nr:hypothetical protein [Pseudoroseicyclus tamaricis]NDV01476.1 hypothetical protein [Pseudoroseicyclus tamaricis]